MTESICLLSSSSAAVCSLGLSKAGVPQSRWQFPLALALARGTWFYSCGNRREPGMLRNSPSWAWREPPSKLFRKSTKVHKGQGSALIKPERMSPLLLNVSDCSDIEGRERAVRQQNHWSEVLVYTFIQVSFLGLHRTHTESMQLSCFDSFEIEGSPKTAESQ